MEPKHLTVIFPLKSIVYLVVDPNQYPRIVTGIVIRSDAVKYIASDDKGEMEFYDFELQDNRNFKYVTL